MINFGRDIREVSGTDEFHRQLTFGGGLIDHPNFTKSTAADFSNQFEITNPGAGLERERGEVWYPGPAGTVGLCSDPDIRPIIRGHERL